MALLDRSVYAGGMLTFKFTVNAFLAAHLLAQDSRVLFTQQVISQASTYTDFPLSQEGYIIGSQ